MADANVFAAAWDRETPELGRRSVALGPKVGAAELGVSLFELDPGGAVSPLHVHHGNKELLLVLSGQPRLRTPDGTRELEPGALVAFPRGPAGAHQIANPGDAPARVPVFSTINPNGSLTLIASVPFGSARAGAVDARLSPDGKTLLVNGSAANVIASFAVNGGTLTELSSSPTPLPAGAVASGLVVN